MTRASELTLLVQEPLLVFLGVVPAFGLELGELRVLLEEQGWIQARFDQTWRSRRSRARNRGSA